jgi:uncharacterized phage-associated protein
MKPPGSSSHIPARPLVIVHRHPHPLALPLSSATGDRAAGSLRVELAVFVFRTVLPSRLARTTFILYQRFHNRLLVASGETRSDVTVATYSAEQIASYFLSLPSVEENDISNLKLQKLCYYAQGFLTAMRGEQLVSEDVRAWDHGPVVPEIYHKYKGHGSQPIPVVTDFDVEQIREPDRKALDDIYDYYGQFSAWRLRNMTHEEKPWIDAYNTASGKRIEVKDMVEFFAPQIDDDYARGLYGAAE